MTTLRLGIIGHPVAHSLSPVFQGAALRALGVDATYDAWDTPPNALAERVESLRASDVLGANVTIPHKQAVVPLLDELDPLAVRIGAVNTVVNEQGRLTGYNTDGAGFVRALRDDAHFDPRGRSILLLGAGGAARGIAFALLEAGVVRLEIANRTAERADALSTELRSHYAAASVQGAPYPPADLSFDCIVNTTSVGMHGGGAEEASPCDLRNAKTGALAVDIVYAPAETPFLRAAAARGLSVLGGLPMLIFQGVLAFELWTGRAAPVGAMFDAARAALAERGSH